jgi:hypothetical protein
MQACKVTQALVVLSLLVSASCVCSIGQTVEPAMTTPATDSQNQTPTSPAQNSPQSNLSKQYVTVEADLKKQSTESEFSFQLGVGSLLRNGNVTDYVNNANTLSATSIGWATPQYLVGLAMRAPFANFRNYGSNCKGVDAATPSNSNNNEQQGAINKKAKNNTSPAASNTCPLWRQRPWSGFLSLKFAPSSSQTINGYVLGGSYSLTSHLDLLVGFSLTPVNVPASGLRNAAYNYVLQQQKLGNDMQFNPEAMLNNSENAFDGFSLLDSSGKLIYTGTPLEIDYRGGVVVGVSIPLSFGSFFKGQ